MGMHSSSGFRIRLTSPYWKSRRDNMRYLPSRSASCVVLAAAFLATWTPASAGPRTWDPALAGLGTWDPALAGLGTVAPAAQTQRSTAPGQRAQSASESPDRWEATIKKFEDQGKVTPPPQ